MQPGAEVIRRQLATSAPRAAAKARCLRGLHETVAVVINAAAGLPSWRAHGRAS